MTTLLQNRKQYNVALDDDQRHTLVLALGYEQVRREFGQYGYRVFTGTADQVLRDRRFAVFVTVRQWLEKNELRISWREHRWLDYMRYAFKRLSPTVPQPAQLKNPVLLREFRQNPALRESHDVKPQRTEKQLRDLYSRILAGDASV